MMHRQESIWRRIPGGLRLADRKDLLAAFALVLLAGGLTLAALFAERLNEQYQAEALRTSVRDRLAVVRSRLEANLAGDIQLVKGLVAVIAANPDLDQALFARAAQALFEGRTRLNNIDAAQGMVIRLIYPVAGNEKAIGLDFRTRPDQLPALELARRTRQVVVTGPVELVQGRCGFIPTVPVYTPGSRSGDGFWGFLSAVIRCEQLYRDSGLLDDDLPLDLAICGSDGAGAQGKVFFGDADLFNATPVLAEIPLPQGSWLIAGIPRGGWPAQAANAWSLRLVLLAVILLVLAPFLGLLHTLRVASNASRRMANALSLTEATLEATDNGILVIDRAGRVVSSNRRFAQMWRIPEDLLTTRDDQKLLAHVIGQLADPQQFLDKVLALYDQPEATSRDTLTFGDGRIFARFSHPQRLGTAILGRVWSFLDITEQARAEQSVRELSWAMTEELERSERQRRLLQSLLSAIPDAVWMKDSNGVFLFCNAEFEQMLGLNEAQILGTTDDDYFPPEVALAFRADDRRAAESPTPILREEWLTYASDGRRARWATVKTAVRSEDGKLLGVLGIARDVTKQHALLAELEQAHRAALAANAAKSSFLTSMSHELRTPLNVIIGFSQMLELGVPTPLLPQQQEAVGHILVSGRHLLALINEVLDLARIESGRLDLSLETVMLQPLIEEAITLSQPAATARQIAIQPLADTGLALHADRTRLRQVLLNLLSNAVKYNRPGGQIRVDCQPQGERVRVTVTDTGHGIPAAHHSEVFQPFLRLSAERSNIEGTGIGLVLCKYMIDAMGGRIGFDSEPERGSRFWFELARAQPVPGVATEVAPETTVWKDAADPLPQGRVLYVEDNPLNVSVMRHIFSLLPGVELLMASSGEMALEQLEQMAESLPDLVLMDINLPGMSGLEVLNAMRATARTAAIPVFAVSASAMPDEIKAGLDAGFQAYLTKPFETQTLVTRIRNILSA
jgi:two-component system, sensor histidine kinase and response regulator